jgi:hypothetical protein
MGCFVQEEIGRHVTKYICDTKYGPYTITKSSKDSRTSTPSSLTLKPLKFYTECSVVFSSVRNNKKTSLLHKQNKQMIFIIEMYVYFR